MDKLQSLYDDMHIARINVQRAIDEYRISMDQYLAECKLLNDNNK